MSLICWKASIWQILSTEQAVLSNAISYQLLWQRTNHFRSTIDLVNVVQWRMFNMTWSVQNLTTKEMLEDTIVLYSDNINAASHLCFHKKRSYTKDVAPVKKDCVIGHVLSYIYIYIYIPLRKTKTGHIRIINLFPSCVYSDCNYFIHCIRRSHVIFGVIDSYQYP